MRRNRAPDHAAGPPARVLIALVEAYRRWLSPLTPARCRFLPTCSAYAIQAIRERGVLVGVGLSTWRVLRCHPFHPGGYDPVPRRRGDDPGASSVQCESPPSGVIR